MKYDRLGECTPEKDFLWWHWLTFRQPERTSSSDKIEWIKSSVDCDDYFRSGCRNIGVFYRIATAGPYAPPGGGLRISRDGDDRRIFWGLKFSIPRFFWVGEFGKYFCVCVWLDLSRDFLGYSKHLKILGSVNCVVHVLSCNHFWKFLIIKLVVKVATNK